MKNKDLRIVADRIYRKTCVALFNRITTVIHMNTKSECVLMAIETNRSKDQSIDLPIRVVIREFAE
jgi:hypothetical protein